MPDTSLVMGVDFGSDSVRILLIDAADGSVAGKGVAGYRRWADGLYCSAPDKRFRQHPLDYLEGLEQASHKALAEAGPGAGKRLRGVCVDATGSTPGPVDALGRPLALSPEFADNPNAMFILWKDHTAGAEAEEFNRRAADWKAEDFLRYQGLYSSEWFWAKILKTVRDDPAVRAAAHNWIEEGEWITAILCDSGPDFVRSACTAGHKALWHSAFGGLPARRFLSGMNDYLGLVYDRYTAPLPSDRAAGLLCREWAERWGAGDDVVVASGLIDAHAGAVECGVRPGVLVKVVGTSGSDMLVARAEDITPGDTKHLFGMAENSIVPGLIGIEAGQAAFGDVFRWLEGVMAWRGSAGAPADGSILAMLSDACVGRPPPRVAALDWFNGRRYPYVNDGVKSMIMNLDLSVDAPTLYQSLATAVAFGARRMVDGYIAGGIAVDEVICAGGVARKSPYIMQVLADVLERRISISASEEACAKGSALFAARAAGLYPTLESAQQALSDGMLTSYTPMEEYRDEYRRLFAEYIAAGEFMEARSRV